MLMECQNCGHIYTDARADGCPECGAPPLCQEPFEEKTDGG